MAKKEIKVDTQRHSLSHVMATAVQELFPGARFGIGPVIENGFYYDFDLPRSLTPEDLPKVEEKMKEIIKKDLPFKKRIMKNAEAAKLFKKLGQPYKVELIKEMKGQVTIYETGGFIDLCRGPHIKSAKELPINGFKLRKVAGAYWRGDEKNPMLQRIYGVAFQSKKELNDFTKQEEEAEKRDHRVLGQRLGIFMIDDEVGAGLPLWLPKGATLRYVIEAYLRRELRKQGYEWLVTPHIANVNLWKTSGHWGFYRESMYSPIEIDKEQYLIKPMNCPFHIKVYKSQIRSYRELPLKFAELGTVYRYERSGTLHGLTRVRGFTQDDAHIWCTQEQLTEELIKLLKFGLGILSTFGFKEYTLYLSTKPEKHVGSDKMWTKSMNALKYALKDQKLKYEIDPGGGVFYGPKIDIKIKDSIGRDWQCTTIQVDFNLPERFKVTYIDQKGKKQQPIMIHRALLGSLERFIGVLLENHEGSLPLWLSPEQIWIIPIGSKHEKYAKQVAQELEEKGLRVSIKNENETVSRKIREGEIQKIPYILVVGDKEEKSQEVAVRERKQGDTGTVKVTKFIEKILSEIEKKK